MTIFKLLSIAGLVKKKRWWALILLIGSTGGYAYKQDLLTIDQYWKEPRDLLVDRVEDARDAQQETAEQFKTALENFKEVTGFSGGNLEAMYETLNTSLKRSEKKAAGLDKKITRITRASNDLLSEWKEELTQYDNPELKRQATEQFDATRDHCQKLLDAMREAEKKTKPVIAAFKDQVLYIKHNLNAKAITSLDEETAEIEQDVGELIADMEASIAEADAFIDALDSEG